SFSRDWSSDVCSSDLKSGFVEEPRTSEVILARHCGLKVIAIGLVANMASGIIAGEPQCHDKSLKIAKKSLGNLSKLITLSISKKIGRASCRESVSDTV